MFHFTTDYPRGSVLMCFHCKQVGHKKADCPRLMGGVVITHAPVTLSISNGREGRIKTPTASGRALQLQLGLAKLHQMLSWVFYLLFL